MVLYTAKCSLLLLIIVISHHVVLSRMQTGVKVYTGTLSVCLSVSLSVCKSYITTNHKIFQLRLPQWHKCEHVLIIIIIVDF